MARISGQNILNVLSGVLGVIFQTGNLTSEQINQIRDRIHAIVQNLEREISELRELKFDPQWKNRVINVPAAADQIRSTIVRVGIALKTDANRIAQPFKDFATEIAAFRASQEAQQTQDVSRLVRGFDELKTFINSLNTLVGDVSDALDAVGDLQDVFDKLKDDLTTLDDLFLKQGNQRKTLQTTDGESFRIRLGNLHS